jgi:restriction system protein
MAEITRKRIGELQRGVIKILLEHPDGMPAKELLEKLQRPKRRSKSEKSSFIVGIVTFTAAV